MNDTGTDTARSMTSHGSTLFVTRLPYTVTNTDLATFFSNVGPLRRAFVVTDRDTHTSKGIGYVTFADSTDAARCLEQLQGASIDGSSKHIQLQWAERRTHGEERKQAAADKRPREIDQRDPDAVRTIVISGLLRCNPPADTKTIYKRVLKIGDVESVDFAPVDGSTSNDVAYVRFRTPNHAMSAIQKLHAHQFKGAQLNVDLKKRVDNSRRREQHMRPETLEKQRKVHEQIARTSGIAPSTNVPLSRSSRVIVRNLPFDLTEADLLAVFLPFGAVYDVSMPRTEDNERIRGFAFVWFVSRADAERAIADVNGTELRHGMAEQNALKNAQGKSRTAAKEALERVTEKAQPARPVAVDWAVSQKEWVSMADEKKTHEPEDEEDGEVGKDVDDDMEDEDEGQDGEFREDDGVDDGDEEEEEVDDDEGNDEDAGEDEMSAEDEIDKPVKPKLSSTDDGTTLFIRNVPYQATEKELLDLFRAFGPLRYARITMDNETKRSRGSGFVCFWKRDSADEVLRQAEIVARETSAFSAPEQQSNPFSAPSVITADPSAPLVARFTLHGRVLSVVRAVTRDTASKLEKASRKSREKGDKRNTWLMREGVPFPDTPLASQLGDGEKERRLKSFGLRRAQMGANPSLHISKTRLAVHQLPLFVNDKLLKRLALHALRTFNNEVKEGTREDLDEEEKEDQTVSSVAKPTKEGKNRPPPSAVVQAKVVLQTDRIDPLSGKGRSRGYGFLEMRTFNQALRVLRWANANPAVGPMLVEWWKEEMQTTISKLKNASDDADSELRAKRLANVLRDLQDGGNKVIKSELRGLLRVEFSIDNVTTVRKRALRQAQAREKSAKRRKVDVHTDPQSGPELEPQSESEDVSMASADASLKPSNVLGGMIGKKRKERKRKHANRP